MMNDSITLRTLPRRLARRAASLVLRRIRSGPGAGLRFYVERAGLTYLLGTNERPVQDALAELLRPGDVFYDVGANLGFFSVIGARAVGPRGYVFAFEPVRPNAHAIRRNAFLNGFEHVHVLEQALSSETGIGQLVLADHAGGARLDSASDAAARSRPVNVSTIDDLVSSKTTPAPDVVKIDVEGAEVDVLLGMRQVLRTRRPSIVCEIDDVDPEAVESRMRRIVDLLQKEGYHVRRLPDSYPGATSRVVHLVAVFERSMPS